MIDVLKAIGDFFAMIWDFFVNTWNLLTGAIESISEGWDFFDMFFLGAAPDWAKTFFSALITVGFIALIWGWLRGN